MMMSVVSGSPRVVKRRLTDGDVSYAFSVCRHVRIMGKPSHIPIAKFGTFRRSEFRTRAAEFWKIVDRKLDELVRSNKLWQVDRQRIESTFEKHIARPFPITPKVVEPPLASNYEILKQAIATVAEKAERELAKRGY